MLWLLFCCFRRVSGTIRESGGAFGKREAALEEQYFRSIQAKQMEELRKSHEVEIEFHKKEIARHQVRRIILLYCLPYFVVMFIYIRVS